MTSLISARRAAEDFARVVDGSQQDVADRYADLTATVDLLRRQEMPAARPEFVADLDGWFAARRTAPPRPARGPTPPGPRRSRPHRRRSPPTVPA